MESICILLEYIIPLSSQTKFSLDCGTCLGSGLPAGRSGQYKLPLVSMTLKWKKHHKLDLQDEEDV